MCFTGDPNEDLESDNTCGKCHNELYAGRCLTCNPTDYEKRNILPEDYTPGDPFW